MRSSQTPLNTYIHCVNWTEFSRVRALRERSRPAALTVHTIEGFRKHRSGRNAALIAHFGFLSVFPLLLVFTTVLGFVLQSRPKLRDDIVDSALAQLPFVGEQIAADPSKLRGDALVLVIGLLASSWGGMKAFVAVHSALDDIAETALDDRSNLFITRLRALFGMAYIGGAQIGAAILASLATASGIMPENMWMAVRPLSAMAATMAGWLWPMVAHIWPEVKSRISRPSSSTTVLPLAERNRRENLSPP